MRSSILTGGPCETHENLGFSHCEKGPLAGAEKWISKFGFAQ
jgi:hypothetical protein